MKRNFITNVKSHKWLYLVIIATLLLGFGLSPFYFLFLVVFVPCVFFIHADNLYISSGSIYD